MDGDIVHTCAELNLWKQSQKCLEVDLVAVIKQYDQNNLERKGFYTEGSSLLEDHGEPLATVCSPLCVVRKEE